MKGMIDLGKKPEPCCDSPKTDSKAPKVYYPSLYVSGIDALDGLPDGEFTFTGKGKVVSKTESTRDGKKTCSCDIEIHAIKPDGKAKEPTAAEGLDAALSDAENPEEEMAMDEEAD
jgi:hypothetical protein